MNILAVARQGRSGGAAVTSGGNVLACVEAPLEPEQDFPADAVKDCLAASRLDPGELERVLWCGEDREALEVLRPLRRAHPEVPGYVQRRLRQVDAELARLALRGSRALESVAAAAYFASPFPNAAIILVPGEPDQGVHLWQGEGSTLRAVASLPAPHSPSRFLDVFGHYLGLHPERAAYELAYLAAYGLPRHSTGLLAKTVETWPDGSFRLKGPLGSAELPPETAAERVRHEEMAPPVMPGHFDEASADVARSVVAVLRYLMGHLLIQSRRRLGTESVCLGGDWLWEFSRNRLLPEDGLFQRAWIHPQRGPAALALGAALNATFAGSGDRFRRPAPELPFLGAHHSGLSIETFLRESQIPYDELPADQVPRRIAELIRNRLRVGWFQGREESGTGAAGQRVRLSMVDRTSLERLGDPRRTGLVPRPLTILVLADQFDQYFEPEAAPPYRSAEIAGPWLCFWRRDDMRETRPGPEGQPFLRPALTDRGPVFAQRVHPQRDPALYRLLSTLQERTGLPLLVAEALRDESGNPIRTPASAYALLRSGRLEALLMGQSLVLAGEDLPDLDAPVIPDRSRWRRARQAVERVGRTWRPAAEAAARSALQGLKPIIRKLRRQPEPSTRSGWLSGSG
jgi:carbamoyltransferase